MIEIKKYQKENKKIWNDFINNSKNGIFMFNRDFMEYHCDRFIDNSLMFYKNDEPVALLPANLKENILYSHGGLTYGGFITNSDMKQTRMLECFEALKEYLKENKIEKLIYKRIPNIFHKMPADEDLYGLFKNRANLLKVEPSTTILLSNPVKMLKSRKSQISRAKREGVEIIESNDFKTFIELENSVLKERHNATAVHTALELELLRTRFPENIKLFAANYQEKMIAGCLVFEYENVVHTQYLATNEKGREIGALDLLIKTLIDKYEKTKTYFDFGISTEDSGNFLNEGLIFQKEGFGGRTIVYSTWEVNFEQ